MNASMLKTKQKKRKRFGYGIDDQGTPHLVIFRDYFHQCLMAKGHHTVFYLNDDNKADAPFLLVHADV